MQPDYTLQNSRASRFDFKSSAHADTLATLVAMINKAHPVSDKKQGPIIHFGRFDDGIRTRTMDAIQATTAISLDYDGRGGDTLTREAAEAALARHNVAGVLWDSFSANGAGTTFRLVLPFAYEQCIDTYRGAAHAACELLGIPAPGKILPASQGYFFSPNKETGHATNAKLIEGKFIDDVMDMWDLPVDEHEPAADTTHFPLTEKQVSDARTVIAAMREGGHHLSNGSGVWHRVIGALAPYGETGRTLAHEFSEGDPEYNARDVDRKIKSKLRNGATGIGNLFQIAGDLNIENPAAGNRATAEEDFADDLTATGEIKLEAIEYTLDGFLSAGVTYIAGGHGIGKSSLLVPLACIVSGELSGKEQGMGAILTRKVIYITEDPQQARRVRYGLKKHNGLVENGNFAIIQAKRRTAGEIEVGVEIAVKKHTITGPNGYPIKPLIVFDTTNACFEIENENDAAEVGRIMSALKQAGAPVWIVGHLAKAIARDDIAAMTGRGSGAWEADAQCTAFIFAEDENTDVRYMATKKRRFEPSYIEVKYVTKTDHEIVTSPWGEDQRIGFRYGIPERAHPEDRRDAQIERREADLLLQLEQDINVVAGYLQRQEGPVSKLNVEQWAGVPRNRTRAALGKMVERGLVDNKVQYLIPPNQNRDDGIQLRVATF